MSGSPKSPRDGDTHDASGGAADDAAAPNGEERSKRVKKPEVPPPVKASEEASDEGDGDDSLSEGSQSGVAAISPKRPMLPPKGGAGIDAMKLPPPAPALGDRDGKDGKDGKDDADDKDGRRYPISSPTMANAPSAEGPTMRPPDAGEDAPPAPLPGRISSVDLDISVGSLQPDQPAALSVPAPVVKFGRYQMLGRVAVGGMAEIFLARE
jgi:hypothetical protein